MGASQFPAPGNSSDARVGQLLMQRYLVYRVVADGGMGRVYEALDKVQNRHVAVKILHPEVARDEVSLERFKREYEVSRHLPHEHIVDVIDFRPTGDGGFALVMEFLVGEELRATLKREQVLSPERAIRMLSQVALGLDLAHSRDLIHRDLKPDNIFLCQTATGDLSKILDFGSVKDKSESAKQLTVMGTTIGSPYYMAPEQAQGLDTLDHRADVWSLAAIFYEVVAGTVPFKGVNGPSILLGILTQEPTKVSEAASGRAHRVPATLDPVMAQAFMKVASLRTNSAGSFADAVGQAYGLGGDHREWAVIDEAQLGAIIDHNLRNAPLPSVEQHNDAARFFGQGDPLASEPQLDLSSMDAAFADAKTQLPGADLRVHSYRSAELARPPQALSIGATSGSPAWRAETSVSISETLKVPTRPLLGGVLVGVVFLVCGVVLGLVFLR